MKLNKLGLDSLRRASNRLYSAQAALQRGDHPDAVRYSQECVELALKSCLRALGLEHPRTHDVGNSVLANAQKFPPWFRQELSKLAQICTKLAMERVPSVYGDELKGIPSSELYGEADAISALRDAEYVFECARRLLKELD